MKRHGFIWNVLVLMLIVFLPIDRMVLFLFEHQELDNTHFPSCTHVTCHSFSLFLSLLSLPFIYDYIYVYIEKLFLANVTGVTVQ